MKSILLAWFFCVGYVYGISTITPIQQIETNGTVKDMVLRGNTLIIGTDEGQMQVYDYVSKKFVQNILLPNIKDFMGDTIPTRVFSVDKIENRYLLLSDSGIGGYVNLWLHEDNVTTQLVTPADKKAAIKARFITKDTILLGYLSNEASLFDIKSKKELYRVQLSESKFSDFALNEERTLAVFSCESGVLNVVDTKSGKIIKVLKGQNVDNVYKVDFKHNIVSAAGQDRRGAIYDVKTGKGTYIEGMFLMYATALSPSANRVAFTIDEKNYISIYNRNSKTKIAELQGQKSTLNNIIFKDEQTLFSSSDDDMVMMWKIN